MKISGFGEQDTSAWDALHKGTDRENFDSPSHYELSTLKTMLPHRRPSPPPPAPEPPAPVDYDEDDGYEWIEDGESGYWEETGPSSGYYDTESYLTHDDRQVPEDSAYGRRHLAVADDEQPGYYRDPATEPAAYPVAAGYRHGAGSGEADESGHYAAPAEASGHYATRSAESVDASGYYDARSAEPGDASGYYAGRSAESVEASDYYAESAGASGYPASSAEASDYYAEPADESGYYSARSVEPAEASGYYAAPNAEPGDEYASGYYEAQPAASGEAYASGHYATPSGESYEPVESTGRHAVVERTTEPNRRSSGRRHAAVDTADRESGYHPTPADVGYLPPADGQHRLAEPPERTTPRPSGRRRAPEPVVAQEENYAEPTSWPEPPREEPPPAKPAKSRVRPYARTRGRTRSDHNLALEALVSTSDDGRRYRGVRSIEHRRICDLCLDTRSVAEIAAHLHLPLGVVKVLVGDMADIGLVLIHQTDLVLGDRSSREFMERVLQGLRNL
ncbi:DUF742 domain-containing protein [Amycolatopsis sp. NPDC051903]|uniref:DUF742 domain-containing protein n=1 Tax=Amycolatopsis sp. NPDC051903 TaxID=3363936 RepID=UPI0037A65A11